ncbi:cupin domain-containing protein (plasmid) [Rhizobium phaseoli]|nr:cupin domain-containing protein [Rhizobium phaseoli]
MSLLVTIDTNPDFTPKDAVPGPERLISGNPFFKTWAQDASKVEKVLTGVWEDDAWRASFDQRHHLRILPYYFGPRRNRGEGRRDENLSGW